MKWPTFRIARVWVVDGAHPGASDTNPGTADAPFLTFGRGVKALRAGDTLQVRKALYREHLGDVRTPGTASAPILIDCEPGVILRPTTVPTADPTALGDGLYSLPASASFRLVETDAAAWDPITVHDPNGVHFELGRPVPSHLVQSLETLRDVPGSSWYDAAGFRVVFRPYGSVDHGLECYNGRTLSFRGTHTTIRGLAVEYAAVVQVYGATAIELDGLASCGGALQLSGTKDCRVSRAFVEQVITRGDGFQWFDKGAGQGMQITDSCVRTTVSDVVVRHGWNGVSWNGTQTTVDGAVVYGFPNHGFGVAGNGNTYRRVKAYQAQEGGFFTAGSGIVVEDCEIERAIVLGGGHTLTGKGITNFTFRRNTVLGSGMINASDDTVIRESDGNYWLTTVFDWRYQNTRTESLEDIRARFGFERASVWDNRNLPR